MIYLDVAIQHPFHQTSNIADAVSLRCLSTIDWEPSAIDCEPSTIDIERRAINCEPSAIDCGLSAIECERL